MLGAIVGDIAGSKYERNNCRNEEQIEFFKKGSRCTDDTVLTLATAKNLMARDDGGELNSNDSRSYAEAYREMGNLYPYAGYGRSFNDWRKSHDSGPYGSYGNGSAMRVSCVGWVATSLEWCMKEAERSAEVTHNHPEGIKGAQATACAVFLARTGKSKAFIKKFLEDSPFGYDLSRSIAEIRPKYKFDSSCQGSVPEAIIAFLESDDFESAIRRAISLGGDSDTIACIAGAIAHAFYGHIPDSMIEYCRKTMDSYQRNILDSFWAKYNMSGNFPGEGQCLGGGGSKGARGSPGDAAMERVMKRAKTKQGSSCINLTNDDDSDDDIFDEEKEQIKQAIALSLTTM